MPLERNEDRLYNSKEDNYYYIVQKMILNRVVFFLFLFLSITVYSISGDGTNLNLYGQSDLFTLLMNLICTYLTYVYTLTQTLIFYLNRTPTMEFIPAY